MLCSIFGFSQKEIEFPNTEKGSRNLEKLPTLTAKLSENQYDANEVLLLEFTIKNETGYTIVLFDTIPERSFDILVMDDEGNEIPLSEKGKKRKCPDIIMGRESLYLAPGRTFQSSAMVKLKYKNNFLKTHGVGSRFTSRKRTRETAESDLISRNVEKRFFGSLLKLY